MDKYVNQTWISLFRFTCFDYVRKSPYSKNLRLTLFMKIAKNHDFRKKSIFPIVQISDLYIDIWSEMSPWGLQKSFYVNFWYLNLLETIFGKIDFLVFLDAKIPKNSFFRPKIWIFRRFPDKSAEIWNNQYVKSFQLKNPHLMGTHLWNNQTFVKIHQNPKIGNFHIF